MSDESMRVIERGFLGPRLVFERRRRMRPDEAARRLGKKHARAMAAGILDMVELEFPDCPLEDRYFRVGTNPAGMVLPVGIELTDLGKKPRPAGGRS